jgi:ABC-type transport system involved in multi-copper enzyme maturation permease subunit
MNWLAWRQHRKQFIVAGIFLVLFAAFMIPTGLNFWHTYQHALSTCANTNTCNQLSSELLQSNVDQILLHLVKIVVVFIPIILGLFWGVPFLAREYADGTNKLIWTQSVSRKKWLTIKLTWALAGTVITAGAFVALDTWWFKTSNALNLDRFQTLQFSSQGIELIGCAVFAVALGIMFGAWFRRTMVALGVTLFVLIAIVVVIVPNFIRPYYETPLSYKASLLSNSIPGTTVSINGRQLTSSSGPISGAALVVSQGPVNSQNQPLDTSNPPKQCIVTNPGGGVGSVGKRAAIASGNPMPIISMNGGPAISVDCLNTLGYKMQVKYQPSYRYWDFQRIEAAMYLALSVIPIGATYWLVLRRDA